jgi:HD-GYP domain-containing protein (c-di-GMP phosphodiesterase class II)
MMPIGTSNSEVLAGMESIFHHVRAHLRELGLNLSVWEGQGQAQSRCVGGLDPASEFCRCLGQGASCAAAIGELAGAVTADGQPAQRQTPWGCTLLGMPVRNRRRLSGSTVACYPTSQWLDEEACARHCATLGLDQQVMAGLARGACRHGVEEAPDLLRVAEQYLEAAQANHTADHELATLSTNLSSTYEELTLLYTISGSMKVNQGPQEFLLGVCRELLEVMNISAAVAVVYAHPPATQEEIVVVAGEIDLSAEDLRGLAETHVSRRLAKYNRALVDNHFVWRTRPELGKAVSNLIAVPLFCEKPLGLLLGLNKNADEFSSMDMKLMSSIGNQSAVFLANNMLYADLQDLLMGVLHALTASIDAKDPYTCGHSNRVAMISRRLAEECQLDAAKVQQIYLAGLLHDVGKIGVPESTLCKPGRLTDEEYEAIKRHPGIGAKILGGIRQLDDIIPGILCHHERLDGKGYPEGISGYRLPLEARIIGLADCFDAMTSDRIYRKALPLETVLAEIHDHAGTQFDPVVAEKFLALDLAAFLEELRQPAKTVFPVAISQEAQE